MSIFARLGIAARRSAASRAETTARECKQCWKDRLIFDRALEWWRTGNTGFTPSKIAVDQHGSVASMRWSSNT
jgi:hypothetical protein